MTLGVEIETPAEFAARLEGRIKTQLSHEYHEEDRQEEAFNSLTVPQLLDMLSYMFGGQYD